MIESKKELKEWLDYERSRYPLHTGFHGLARYLAHDEITTIWQFQKILRKAEYHLNTGHKIRYSCYWVVMNYLKQSTGLRIDCNVFDKGLRIMHLGPVLTNPRAKVGKNARVHFNTAFVASGRDSSSPTVGDNVVIGIGATLVGGVFIADDIAIGAMLIVNKSFYESGITIAGNPAKKISNNGSKVWNRKENN